MTWKPHNTVASVIRRQDRYLLVEEKVAGQAVLNQPAGHLEPNESLCDAAIREAYEETGYRIALTGLIGVYLWKSPRRGDHFVRTTFAARVLKHDAQASLDQGIIAALWLTRTEIELQKHRLRSPMVLGSIHDYEAGEPYPVNIIKDLREHD